MGGFDSTTLSILREPNIKKTERKKIKEEKEGGDGNIGPIKGSISAGRSFSKSVFQSFNPPVSLPLAPSPCLSIFEESATRPPLVIRGARILRRRVLTRNTAAPSPPFEIIPAKFPYLGRGVESADKTLGRII